MLFLALSLCCVRSQARPRKHTHTHTQHTHTHTHTQGEQTFLAAAEHLGPATAAPTARASACSSRSTRASASTSPATPTSTSPAPPAITGRATQVSFYTQVSSSSLEVPTRAPSGQPPSATRTTAAHVGAQLDHVTHLPCAYLALHPPPSAPFHFPTLGPRWYAHQSPRETEGRSNVHVHAATPRPQGLKGLNAFALQASREQADETREARSGSLSLSPSRVGPFAVAPHSNSFRLPLVVRPPSAGCFCLVWLSVRRVREETGRREREVRESARDRLGLIHACRGYFQPRTPERERARTRPRVKERVFWELLTLLDNVRRRALPGHRET